MATTKKTTTTTRRAPSAKTDTGIAARTGRTLKQRPYTSAAIATGAITAVAVAFAGLFFFRRSDKSLGEFTNDLTSRAKDGLADIGTKAKDTVSRLRDGIDKDKSQSEIAEEALTLKETGKKASIPVDPVA
ncbi:MAG: hypothetical protein ABIR25_04090 [Sphingomicrobium sp.]